MAKTPASVGSRPWMVILARHHFWLLALLVPLVLLPLLFLARGQLAAQINVVREQIKGHISALQSVRRIPQHPNESWSNDIDTSTMRVKRETFAEWRKFWASQQAIRVWPESLGPDFLKAVETLKPEGKLSRKLLERYQNNARLLVRDLPARLKVEDHMADATEADPGRAAARVEPMRPGTGRPGLGQPDSGTEQASPYFLSWNPENQKRIASSFDWEKAPTTTQVVLAQEELWVYGLLADAIARINQPATGVHNAAISGIDEFYVGYPAAEDNPGGASGGRVARATASSAAGGPMMEPPPDMPQPGAEGAPVGRPVNPRFAGSTQAGPAGGQMPPGGEEGAVAAIDPDQQLKNWVYVDFNGKPLDATQLATAVDSQMVHLVPFVLRVMIDQRQIDRLLVELSTSPIPIDVRQVRINASSAAIGPGGMVSQPAPTQQAPGGGGRFYDVQLELRGTVGLATQPDGKIVGLEPGQTDDASGGEKDEKPAAAGKAAMLHRSRPERIIA